jgi:serine/threonine-protein kinase
VAEPTFQPEPFGKYILLEKLATGGMAEVYLAKMPGAENVSKYFAIKRILPQFSGNLEFIEMFKEEAKIAVNLSHSNVVSIYEFGELNGQFYIVMEFVGGRNLRQILNKLGKVGKRFSIDQILFVIGEVAKGLDHAHRSIDGTTGRRLNITHRDMSPQNVMVSFDGEIKIVDFGIAKAESKIENTRAGTLKGKFGYMSPEQADGQEVDFRTDIFSVGIVFWELIAGERLFVANNEINTLRKIRDCVVPSLNKIDPSIPAELERIVNKALARDRNLRYQSCSELQKDISKFMNRQYPDFSPQDFSHFMRSVFTDELKELREKLIQFAKVSGSSMNEKTEVMRDHTQTVTETANPPSNFNRASFEDKLKEINFEVSFKKDGTKPKLISDGSTGLMKNATSIGLPPTGTSTNYTNTMHKRPSNFGRNMIVAILVIGGGFFGLSEYNPKLLSSLLSSSNEDNSHQKQTPANLPVETKQLASKDPSIPDKPPAPTTFKVLVRSNPMGAEILLDGTKTGQRTPAEIEVPANRPVKITLWREGYAKVEKETVTTRSGEVIDVTLERTDIAYISVTVRPAQAFIYIDRKPIGRSPIEKHPIPANKQIEILAYDDVSGLQDSEKVLVKPDTTRPVELFLRSRSGSRGTSSKSSR